MGVLKIWDGTAWQTSSASGDGASVFVGPDAPPGTPGTGDLWYDTDQTSQLVLPLTVSNGGTGAANASAARMNLAVSAAGQSGSVAGAPTTGTWVRGDQWLDSIGALWICTASGSPGTWKSPPMGYVASTVIGDPFLANDYTTPGALPVKFNLTLTTDASRAYEIHFYALTFVQNITTNANWDCHLRVDGTDIVRVFQMESTTQTTSAQSTSTLWTPTTGSHTLSLFTRKYSSTASTLTIYTSSAYPYQLCVYDVGGR